MTVFESTDLGMDAKRKVAVLASCAFVVEQLVAEEFGPG